MTTVGGLSRKVAAATLAASMLQPAAAERKKLSEDYHNGTFVTDLQPTEQEDIYTKAAGLLQKLERREIDPVYYQEIVWDLAARHQPIENKQVTLKHVYKYFRNCAGRFNFVDNWAHQWSSQNFPTGPRDDLGFQDLWLDLEQKANAIVMRNPEKHFRQVFLEAVQRVKPEQYLHQDHIRKWKNFNYYMKFKGRTSEEAVLESLTSDGFPIFHPHSALAELAAEADQPTYMTARRIWGLRFLRDQIERTKSIREQAIAVAKRKHVNAEDLALLVGGYSDIGTPRQPVAQLQQQRTEKQQQPFALDIRRTAVSLFPYIRRMYEDGIEAIVITDRGARPLGTIMKHIFKEFDLPEIPVYYCKIASQKKIIEAYARTEQARGQLSADEQEMLIYNAKIRSIEKRCRQSGKRRWQRFAEEILELELGRRMQATKHLYTRLAPIADSMQFAHARKTIGHLAGKRALFIDDFGRTGETRQNIIRTAQATGIDATPEQIIMIIDTPANAGGKALCKDAEGLAASYIRNTGWEDTMVWHKMRGCTGISYGMHAQGKDAAQLFRKQRDLAAYKLPRPANRFYSRREIQQIAPDVARSALIDESLEPVREQVMQKVTSILQEYGVRQSYEATQQRVNIARVAGFHDGIVHEVRNTASTWKGRYGDATRNYLRGLPMGLRENEVDAAVREEIYKLHNIAA